MALNSKRAFAAKSHAEVDAFHAVAIKTGGTDNGSPSLRDTAKGYPPNYAPQHYHRSEPTGRNRALEIAQ
jgi:hypothetical protein